MEFPPLPSERKTLLRLITFRKETIFKCYFSNTKLCDIIHKKGEIFNVLKLLNREDLSPNVFKGSEIYIKDEQTPTVSDAANDLVKRAMNYSPENPLYVVTIGAITNVASALLLKPEIAPNIVIVWLGGHSYNHIDTAEFNMVQDIAAARVVFKSSAPFIQLPCVGVVSHFHFSIIELEHYMRGKNKLCDFLIDRVIEHKKECEELYG